MTTSKQHLSTGVYDLGWAKEDITVFEPNLGMLGYGRPFHRLEGIETRQYARAYVFRRAGSLVVLMNVEFCFPTEALRLALIAKADDLKPSWGLTRDNFMLTAQHTHSTAGGYDQHLIYSLYTPGFRASVFEAYLSGLWACLCKAFEVSVLGHLSLEAGVFDEALPVCFNRSLAAYNANKEQRGQELKPKDRHLACDRSMTVLVLRDLSGALLASINWFGVHTTSVSNRLRKVCYDNKGYAAELVEAKFGGVHAFAQGPCGDVSPNYVWSRRRGEFRGPYQDDYENAAFNGGLQADLASELLARPSASPLGHDLAGLQLYFDFSQAKAKDGSWATTDPAFGMAFLEGTTDGRGAPKALAWAYKGLLRPLIRRGEWWAYRAERDYLRAFYQAQAPKVVVMNLGRGHIMGTKQIAKLALPSFADAGIAYLKQAHRAEVKPALPWVPKVLPLQLLRLGELVLVGIPAEISTQAGRRLQASLNEAFKDWGIKQVQLCPYANAYAGYITTPEEYELQHYEGGHTLYGRHTLLAYEQYFLALAQAFQVGRAEATEALREGPSFEPSGIWRGPKA